MENLLEFKFKEFFTGKERDYGQHIYSFAEDGKKEKGKSWTVTDKLITLENYHEHLTGKQGLGIIPITENNTCRFAVIDVDIYDSSLKMFIDAIDKHNFPLIPFMSKSGGLHIYMFLEEPTVVKEVVDAVKKLAQILAIDIFVKQHKQTMVEIFPKQVRNDKKGSWINLPYYNADNTKQYAVSKGERLTLEKAILLIEKRRTTIKKVDTFIANLPYYDAPPCLQSMYLLDAVGEDEGRNNYLFSFGAYLKKKNENYFESELYDVNNSMKNPISNDELETTLLKSLRKKDYNYKCTQYPCIAYCNKQECRLKEFGVGKHDGYFSNLEYGQLKQFKTSQPYYEWEVKQTGEEEFKELRFKNEDEIIRQDAFLKLCLRELYVLPVKLKQTEWFKIVNQSLKDIIIEIIEEEDEMSVLTLFRTLFIEFLLRRSMAANMDQILAKKVYFAADKQEYLFRAKDLSEFMYVTKNFKFLQPGEINSIIKDMGCRPKKITTEQGRQVRVMSISATDIAKYNTLVELAETANYEPKFEKEAQDY